jgi:multidrug efflux pump subunit AcrA (membrane-fusion protein)
MVPGGAASQDGDTGDAGGDGSDGSDGSASDEVAIPDLTASSGGVEGLVTEVGTVADASSGVASYPVTVMFSDTSGDFNVGATVTVDITYAEVTDAVQVPSLAVTTNTDGTSSVLVEVDGRTETRTVTTGLTSGNMVQITEGLAEGETVVIELPGRGGATDGDSGDGTDGGTGAPMGGFPAGGEGGPVVIQGGGS